MGRIGTTTRGGWRPSRGGRLSARECYRRIVGEGGLTPEYFHCCMTYGEVSDYLTGLSRRYRESWEQTRLSVDIAARCAGNEDGVPLKFPWDTATPSPSKDVSTEDLERMKAEGRELERLMNNNKT